MSQPKALHEHCKGSTAETFLTIFETEECIAGTMVCAGLEGLRWGEGVASVQRPRRIAGVDPAPIQRPLEPTYVLAVLSGVRISPDVVVRSRRTLHGLNNQRVRDIYEASGQGCRRGGCSTGLCVEVIGLIAATYNDRLDDERTFSPRVTGNCFDVQNSCRTISVSCLCLEYWWYPYVRSGCPRKHSRCLCR